MKRSIAWLMNGKLSLIGGAIVLGLLGSANSVTAQSPRRELADGAKVIEFAVKNMGKRIGRGESTDLVNSALKYADAMTQRSGSKKGWQKMLEEKTGAKFPDVIHVWGIKRLTLGKGKKIRLYAAGEIIQFEGCIFEKPDGTQRWEMAHHTAIVKSANGTYVTLLHQNSPHGSRVSETSLDLKWLKPGRDVTHGRIEAYYPEKYRSRLR